MNKCSESDKLAIMRDELFSCVIGDIMDSMGYVHQFLPAGIRALAPDMRVVGRAKTVLEADCSGRRVCHADEDRAFGLMFDVLDSMKESEVYLCTGASLNYACWGELMSIAAMGHKAAGAVIEGFSRDTKGILSLGFPVFSAGPYGQDQGVRGRVIDYNCPIEFSNHVTVHPGDLVFGDIDGVVIIPAAIENEVIEKARDKVRSENMVSKLIREGMPTRQVWDQYGVM